MFDKHLLENEFEVKMQILDLHLYLKFTLPQVFFKHFASKNQLPGLSVNGTLVENGLLEKS